MLPLFLSYVNSFPLMKSTLQGKAVTVIYIKKTCVVLVYDINVVRVLPSNILQRILHNHSCFFSYYFSNRFLLTMVLPIHFNGIQRRR